MPGFNSHGGLKIRHDHVHNILETRGNVKHDQPFSGINGPQNSRAVISFQYKLHEMNLPAVYSVASGDRTPGNTDRACRRFSHPFDLPFPRNYNMITRKLEGTKTFQEWAGKKQYCGKILFGLYESHMQTKWHILSPDPEQVSSLVKGLGCHPLIARALVNRDICTPEKASVFLKPSLADIRSPFGMKGINRAADRILKAVRQREKMVIFGDYDADGITATALLFEFLRYLDAEVAYYIPDRLTEGYGLSRRFVEERAIPERAHLIITVDCGISSHEAVDAAQQAGIDVIITDHHEATPQLPAALSVLNPKQPDCRSGFVWLAGVGVAFNLVLALRKKLRDEGAWESRPEPNLKTACDLVALGTVADMVPLVDENRIYVKAGLEVLSAQPRPGMSALLHVCGLANRQLDYQDLAFKIAPRVNASGRLHHASVAVGLLTAPDMETAYPVAEVLNEENARRRKMEMDIVSEIGHRLRANPALLEKRTLVLDDPQWHQGVIGIVASRLVDRYHRPAVIITVTNGMGKGSARSPNGFNLYDGLSHCAQHLEKFGGHQRAAGLTLRPDNIPAFRKTFENVVSRQTEPEDFMPTLVIDGAIGFSEVSGGLADALEAFAPFGVGNPEPLFLLTDAKVLSMKVVGTKHLQMRLTPNGQGRTDPLEAIYFNGPPAGRHADHVGQIACHVRWNRWRHSKKIQLVIRDWRAAA